MIRAIGIADCDAIAAIEAQTFCTTLNRGRLLDLLKMPVFCGFVYDLNTQSGQKNPESLAGYLLATTIVDEAEILSIAVSKGCQKRGRGEALLKHFLAHIKEKDVEKVLLEVAADNMRALRLYYRHGFVEFGRRTAYYKRSDGFCDAIMMRRACY